MIKVACRHCGSYDIQKNGLSSYDAVLPKKRHRKVRKGSGETNAIERFNNTLRQRCPILVRKSLSFSKDELLYQTRIRIFINHYNSELSV